MTLPHTVLEMLEYVPADKRDKYKQKMERLLQKTYKGGYEEGIEAGFTALETVIAEENENKEETNPLGTYA